jgi:hypothetical protein
MVVQNGSGLPRPAPVPPPGVAEEGAGHSLADPDQTDRTGRRYRSLLSVNR